MQQPESAGTDIFERATASSTEREQSPPAIRTGGFRIPGTTTRSAGLDIQVPEGDVLVLSGAQASGKTVTLLALAGRLSGFIGSVEIHGVSARNAAPQVRSLVALAEQEIVAPLDEDLSVERNLAQALALRGFKPWPAVGRSTVRRQLDEINGFIGRVDSAAGPLLESARVGLPKLRGDALVEDLPPLDRLLLGIEIARVSEAPVLAVDDLDVLRERADRLAAWAYLLTRVGDDTDSTTTIVTVQDDSELRELLRGVGSVPRRGVHLFSLEGEEARAAQQGSFLGQSQRKDKS